jgi:hypothetical protein
VNANESIKNKEIKAALKIVYFDGEKVVSVFSNEAKFRTVGGAAVVIIRETGTNVKQIINFDKLIRIQYLTKDEGKIQFL